MRPEIEYVYNKLKKLRFDFKLSDFNDFRNYYRYDPELMRYVRKDDNDLFIDKNTFKPLEEELEYADSCHKVEEQIGCPLDVVAQALSRGFYIDINKVEIDPPLKNPSGDLILVSRPNDFRLNLWYERIEVASFGHYLEVYLKDYKTTWWLKEDKSE